MLGPVRAWRGDVELELGPPQQRAALAVLLLQGGTSLSPAQLVEALWGGAEPRAATGMVRSYISRLRHALEPDTPIKSIGGGYAIIAPTLDLTEFQHLLTTGDAASLRAALDLWHGTPLSGVNGFEAERVRLEQLRLKAIEDLAAADIEAGHHAGAISALTELITEQPMRERPHELQMLALYRSGRQAEALDVFAQIQRRLEDELGLYPGPELREMQRKNPVLRPHFGRHHHPPHATTSAAPGVRRPRGHADRAGRHPADNRPRRPGSGRRRPGRDRQDHPGDPAGPQDRNVLPGRPAVHGPIGLAGPAVRAAARHRRHGPATVVKRASGIVAHPHHRPPRTHRLGRRPGSGADPPAAPRHQRARR
ncbi:AfsR/SARP family transcriptional regulator [Amycolatopsis sp. NBC_00348]|uniref:AfsR/SARP family transcriptional regulator n=1 Tax=Amycolatopsis sp. NBC_00348 TaxID=2975956 RepID=UPI003FA4BD4B